MTDYALVPLPANGPTREALLREAIAYGGGDELLRKFFACEATAQSLQQQQAQTAAVANRVADIGTHLMDMTEDLVVRADRQRRLDAKRKADQERCAAEAKARAEQEEILEYLETHPEPGGASTDDTHHPGGELHGLDPVDKEHLDPEVETDAGGVPLSYGALPESYIKRESSEDLEPGIGGASHPEPDPEDLGGPQDPKQVPQPVSASFW
jgi:hypothetical protein